MIEALDEFPAIERIDGRQSVPSVDQFRKFIRSVFDFTKHVFRILLGVGYDDENRMVLWPGLVMRVRKVANNLITIEAPRAIGARIWPGKQRYVKTLSIGTIDERSLPSDSDKCLSAVTTVTRVTLQGGTPLRAGAYLQGRYQKETLKANNECSENPNRQQLAIHENTWALKPLFRVRERVDFGSGVSA